MKGMKVNRSKNVWRTVWTSRGFKEVPNKATPKRRPVAPKSEKRSLNPRKRNTAPSFNFDPASLTEALNRSVWISNESAGESPPSWMPNRDFISGISSASCAKTSSSIKNTSFRSTKLTSLRNCASILPNSATSKPNSLKLARSGASHASSSKATKIFSISVCNVRTAKTRRIKETRSSDFRTFSAKRTRDNESLPSLAIASRAFMTSRNILSRSWTSINKRKMSFSFSVFNDFGFGRFETTPCASFAVDASSSSSGSPPLRRTQTFLE